MLPLIAEGALLGLTLALFFGFGPAFFMLVQTSIHRGFWPAVLMAVGIFLNDVFMVFICLLGTVQVITEPDNYFWFGVASGLVLITFGFVTYNRRAIASVPANDQLPLKVTGPHWFVYIAKGFVTNLVNPFVWIFWIGVVVGISARMAGNHLNLIYFFSSTLAVVLISDVVKAFAAYQIKQFVTSRFIQVLNRIVGAALVLFGLFLIARVTYDKFL